jgi:hypothetical protein
MCILFNSPKRPTNKPDEVARIKDEENVSVFKGDTAAISCTKKVDNRKLPVGHLQGIPSI